MRIYNLGIEKTGTSTLAGMLSDHNSRHEYLMKDTTQKLVKWKKDIISRDEFVSFIIDREQAKTQSIIDISTFNHFYSDILLNEFEDSRFILTIRDVESWFISELNWICAMNKLYYFSKIRNKNSNDILDFGDWKTEIRHIHHDTQHLVDYMRIKQRGEYEMFIEPDKKSYNDPNTSSIGNQWVDNEIKNNIIKQSLNSSMIYDILNYYYSSNKKVLDTIPKEKLLILKTEALFESRKEIADFCNVEENTIKCNKRNVSSTRDDYYNYFENTEIKNNFDKLLITFQKKHQNIFISR